MGSFLLCLFLFVTENFLELLNTSILSSTQSEEFKYALFFKKNLSSFLMVVILLESLCQHLLTFQLARLLFQSNLSIQTITILNVVFSILSIYVTMLVKSFAISYPNKISNVCSAIFYYPFKMLMPVGLFMEKLSRFMIKKNKDQDPKEFKKSLYNLVNSEKRLVHAIEDLQIVKKVLLMDETNIDQVMTHKTEFIFNNVNETTAAIYNQIISLKENGNIVKDIIIFSANKIDIQGTLNTFDFLIEYIKDVTFHWQSLIKKPRFIFKNTKLQKALSNFKTLPESCFFIVDEEGDIEGIITEEDINNTLLCYEDEDILEVKDNNVIVSGSYNLGGLNQKLNAEIPEEHITIGGFLTNLAQRIPKDGEKLTWKELEFTILKSQKNKINLVSIVKSTAMLE